MVCLDFRHNDVGRDQPAGNRGGLRRRLPLLGADGLGMKPYLFLDVDGVISPFGGGPPPGYERIEIVATR